MTQAEFDKIIPEVSVVAFAGNNYVVASKETRLGVAFVGIYDELPSKHVDFIKASSLILVPYLNPKDVLGK